VCYLNKVKKISILTSKNFKNRLRSPIAIYADFECFIKTISSCHPNPKKSFTEKYQTHEPSRVSYYLVWNNRKFKPISNTKQNENENIAEIFVQKFERSI